MFCVNMRKLRRDGKGQPNHSRARSQLVVSEEGARNFREERLTLRRMKYGTASTSKDSEMSGKASASICHHRIISSSVSRVVDAP